MKRSLKKLLAYVLGMLLVSAIIRRMYIKEIDEITPQYVFDYADNQPEDYPTVLGAKYFAKLVKEKSEGRICILVKSDRVLGTEQEVYHQVQYGGIDFARISLSSVSELIPELNVLQMPYIYKDSDHMWKVLDGAIGIELKKKTQEYGVVALSWYDAGSRGFYNTIRPITCLEDMEGMRIRVPDNQMMQDSIEALGAIAVPMDYASVFSALESGMIDGAENNWPSYETMGHYEFAKYYTNDEHSRIPELQICSKQTWDKLSKDDQTLIIECAKESSLYERKLWKERERESKKKMMEKGVVVTELSSKEKQRFQDVLSEIYNKYCNEEEKKCLNIIREE